jgi:NTE family protein
MLPPSALSQESPPPEARPTLALVLGGGGAKGAAHIGVIEVLEELQVPVDLIVGTSMGAVVGGLYASGMKSEDLREVVAGLDWSEIFAGDPPRRSRSMRRKLEDRWLTVDFELGMDGLRPTIPPAIAADQNLNFLLKDLLFPVAGTSDFDDLPVRFRAVAADIETGEAVTLGEGSLANAIRASLSIPAVLAPVPIGERLLVDGGIAMNLPVEVALELGADVIIAVDVGAPLATGDELDSAIAVTTQLSLILTGRNARESAELLRRDDILIRPDMTGIEAGDFPEVQAALERGFEAADDAREMLAPLAVSDQEWRRFLDATARPPRPSLRVASVSAEGFSRVSEELILRRVTLQPGDALDFATLRQDLSGIFGLGWFQRVDYRLEPAGPGRAALVIQVQEKSWGPRYLRSGLRLFDDLSGESRYGLVLDYLAAPLTRTGGEFQLWAALGDPLGVGVQFYQPIGIAERFFLVASAEGMRFSEDGGSTRDLQLPARGRSQEVALGGGMNLGPAVELRASGRVRWVGIDEGGDLPAEDLPDHREGGFDLRALVDVLDHRFFPSDGGHIQVLWQANREWAGGVRDWNRLSARGSWVTRKGRNVLWAGGEAATSTGTDLPEYRHFQLGGLGRISGLTPGEKGGPYLGLAWVRYDRILRDFPDYELLRELRVGGSFEVGDAWETASDVSLENPEVGGSLFLGIDTLLGPVTVGFGMASGGETAWYLALGSLR